MDQHEQIDIDELLRDDTTPKPVPRGNAFALHAETLAAKVMSEWIVTAHRHGYYWNDKSGWTVATSKDQWPLTHDRLLQHFRDETYQDQYGRISARAGILMQAHIDNEWKTRAICIESDNHGEDIPENRAEAHARAFAICANIRQLGITPLLEDSDGKGGVHIWIILNDLIPMTKARSFGELMIKSVDPKTEVFPKSHQLAPDQIGNWVRLPGQHYKREHFSRFYDFATDMWLSDADAVRHMLDYQQQDASLIPEPPAEPEPPQVFPATEKTEKTAKTHIETTGDLSANSKWFSDWCERTQVRTEYQGMKSDPQGKHFAMHWTECPFVHASGVNRINDSYVMIYGDKFGYHCSHASCSNKGWKEFRAAHDDRVPEVYEPGCGMWESDAIEWLYPLQQPPKVISFDLSRLPDRIARGIAAIGKRNPLLPLSSQVLVPFAYAGAIIGKRMKVENFENHYYPNLWVVVTAPTNSNKTGTRNVLLRSVPLDIQLPDSPTMEALLERIGRSLKDKDRQALNAARVAAIREDEAELNGGIIVADECTGTFKTLLASDGRGNDKNMEYVLKLATSMERVEQPRIGGGYRIASDLCVSFIGFTQSDTWESHFGDDRYRSNGFIGRIIPCSAGMMLDNVPEVGQQEWTAYCAAVSETVNDAMNFATEPEKQTVIDFGVGDGNDPIKAAMTEAQKSDAWQILTDTLGEYADKLYGKIIGHTVKMAMICQWCSEKPAANWFVPCAELIIACYANYFRTTFGALRGLTSQEQAALAYIRQNPGRSINDLRKKFHLRDNREAWQLSDSLIEAGAIEKRPGKRKDSTVLFLSEAVQASG